MPIIFMFECQKVFTVIGTSRLCGGNGAYMATECPIGCPELVDIVFAHPSHIPTGESSLVTIRMMLITALSLIHI